VGAELFWDLVARFGMPFGMLAIALLSGSRGMWVWQREMAEQARQYEVLLAEARRERDDSNEARDFYEAKAWGLVETTSDVISVTKDAVGKRR